MSIIIALGTTYRGGCNEKRDKVFLLLLAMSKSSIRGNFIVRLVL